MGTCTEDAVGADEVHHSGAMKRKGECEYVIRLRDDDIDCTLTVRKH